MVNSAPEVCTISKIGSCIITSNLTVIWSQGSLIGHSQYFVNLSKPRPGIILGFKQGNHRYLSNAAKH